MSQQTAGTNVGSSNRMAALSAKLVSLCALAMFGLPLAANAQVCGPEVKEEAAKELSAVATAPTQERLAKEAEIYAKYLSCIQDAAPDKSFVAAADQCGAAVSQPGSLFFEEMSCCGYDPQRRQFACPVRIKQPFGFGAAPLPGSREYVMNCVDAGSGLLPVGVDSVHLADESFGQPPSWQFAVIASANQNLATVQPMNGETRRARSILSWGFQPTDCNFQPIWGNAINYRIRLDQ